MVRGKANVSNKLPMPLSRVLLALVVVAFLFIIYRCFVIWHSEYINHLSPTELYQKAEELRKKAESDEQAQPVRTETYKDITGRLLLPYDSTLFDVSLTRKGRSSKAVFRAKGARTQNNFLMVLAYLWPAGIAPESAKMVSGDVANVLAQYGFAFSNYMDPIGACTVAQFLKDSGTPDEASAIAITGVNKQGVCAVYLFSDKLDSEARVKIYALYVDAFVAMKNAP